LLILEELLTITVKTFFWFVDIEGIVQYQQTKRKFEQWWSTILPISTNQKKVWTVMVNNSSNINKPKESLKSDGQQFLQYQQTKRKFEQW
jgi:hypothetical protein